MYAPERLRRPERQSSTVILFHVGLRCQLSNYMRRGIIGADCQRTWPWIMVYSWHWVSSQLMRARRWERCSLGDLVLLHLRFQRGCITPDGYPGAYRVLQVGKDQIVSVS